VLWDLLEPKKIWLQSLNEKAEEGRVRVRRWILTGIGEEKMGKSCAGGLVGIGGRAKTTQQARVRRRGTFFGQSP
jgi:hypothetical protein